jgi:hypothetical protein
VFTLFNNLNLGCSQSVCLGVEPSLWTFHQILFPVQDFGSGICCPVFVWRPLTREAGPVRSYFTTDGRSVSQSVSQSIIQSVCLGIEDPCGTCDQILLPVGMLLSEICGLHEFFFERGARDSLVVNALGYKPEGRVFETR